LHGTEYKITCGVCVCARTGFGAKYLENGERKCFDYNGAPIENDIWRIDWSRVRWRHVT